jgi:hypothetical protein
MRVGARARRSWHHPA